MTSYFPGDRDKESTHSPFSPCTNRVGCVRCWGNFAETNRLALNGLKLWSPVTRVSSVLETIRFFFSDFFFALAPARMRAAGTPSLLTQFNVPLNVV